MMLFRPVEIDFASGHGLERTLHAERTDIDVRQDQSDKQDGHDCMYDLRKLHLGNVGSVEGKQQKEARCRDCHSGRQRKPEDKLLAEVKASGGRVLVLDDEVRSRMKSS